MGARYARSYTEADFGCRRGFPVVYGAGAVTYIERHATPISEVISQVSGPIEPLRRATQIGEKIPARESTCGHQRLGQQKGPNPGIEPRTTPRQVLSNDGRPKGVSYH